MRTGVAYMGHHNPQHMKTDVRDIQALGCDDILLAAQENDFVYMTGKVDFFPAIAKDQGLRPLAVFWGALNVFGGGRSSQFLLECPQAHQVARDGSVRPAGCYNHPEAVARIKTMIDRIAGQGFAGYFIDEPSPIDCYCSSCAKLFERLFFSALIKADEQRLREFRNYCVTHYIQAIADYIKQTYPAMETMCCLMPGDRQLWNDAAALPNVDNLGTDIYWVNEDVDVAGMKPLVRDMAQICAAHQKKHHQWLQAWGVQQGREARIKAQGDILIQENPDALYVWAYQGQIGTSESCADPAAAWAAACEILRKAKGK
jgi:hypothetical protein